MWLIVELRRGDIAQTWAITQSKEAAYKALYQLMNSFDQDAKSWWKVIQAVDDDVQLVASKNYYVAMRVDWEDDNEFEFVKLFEDLQNIPDYIRHDRDIWVDRVRYNPN